MFTYNNVNNYGISKARTGPMEITEKMVQMVKMEKMPMILKSCLNFYLKIIPKELENIKFNIPVQRGKTNLWSILILRIKFF